MGDKRPRGDRRGERDTSSPDARTAVARRTLALFVALVVVAGLAWVLLPRTVASGGTDGGAWELRVSPGLPGLVEPSVRLELPDGAVAGRGLGAGDGLEAAQLFLTPAGDDQRTVLAGPLSRGVNSVRVTSLARGVGEALVTRVGWRAFFVEVLPGDAEVVQVVAIAPGGGVVEVVDDVPRPLRPGDTT